MSMTVLQPGVLALLQDSGRRGLHRLGMTTGGPLDGEAYHFCNRLLANPVNSTVIEISVGGLQLEAQVNTFICVTGAAMPLRINDEEKALWTVHQVAAGDRISVDFADRGCRSYLGVAGGFTIAFAEVTITYAWKKVLVYAMPEPLEPDGLVQLLSTDYKFAVSFAILIIVLLFKPTGLFKGQSI